jgi:hypothetical protein
MSIAADNLLINAKSDLYYRLLGDELLAPVSILIDDEHDMANRALVDAGPRNVRAGKTGASVTVSAVAVLTLNSGETPTPLMSLSCVLEVMEDVIINAGTDGTGLNAGEIVARLIQLLHQSHFDNRFTGLRLAPSAPIVEIDAEKNGHRGYAVTFVADQLNFNVIATCSSVIIDDDDGVVTLTCPTSGTTIYYTIDGSYPGSGNTAATVYTVPLTPSSGVTIRAAAQKTGLNPSKIIKSLTL